MIIGHRIALKPNNVQRTYFLKASGTSRFVYNWALGEWKKQYDAWKLDNTLPKPSWISLNAELNAIKREQFPWMLEVTAYVTIRPIMELGVAFKNFWRGTAKYPQFRKKRSGDRFTVSGHRFRVEGKKIYIGRLGWVRMREEVRFKGRPITVTISRKADRWFASILVETEPTTERTENQGAVGVDLGVTTLATLSNGEKIVGPKAHKALLARQKRLSRSLSRKIEAGKHRAGLNKNQPIPKGRRIPLSSNAQKTAKKLAKLHARIANIRSDAMHKLTTDLTRRFSTIAIEDLNVSGMIKNRRLSRSISDMSFGEFRRQLQYKAERRGVSILVAERFFASSKTCSTCGHKLDVLPLLVREWKCPECSSVHDRDVNAAINIRNLAVSSTVSACGDASSGFARKCEAKLASKKQEVSGSVALV